MRHLPVVAASLLAPILLAACSGAKARPKVVLDRLNAAVDKGDLAAVRAELAAGADPCALQPDGKGSLLRLGGRMELANELIPAAVERGCAGALYSAARYGKTDIVRRLLDRGVSPNELTTDQYSPLTGAALEISNPSTSDLEAKYESARVLLERGADPNAGDSTSSPLFFAIRSGQSRIAKLLIEKGADLNASNSLGPVLAFAAIKGEAMIARSLIDKGANLGDAIATLEKRAASDEWFIDRYGANPGIRRELESKRRAIAMLQRLAAGAPGTVAAPSTGAMTKEELAGLVQAAVEKAAAAKPAAAAPKAIASDADAPGYRVSERPRDFAVVIGVGKYSDLPEASYAEHDAEAVKNHLLALGVPSRNLVLLTGEKASRSGVEKFVETWLARNAAGADRVFFYFSGHGAPNPTSGEAYLMPWDGDPSFLENTAYPLARLYQKLAAVGAKHVLVALDACFSGAGGRSVLAKGTRPLVSRVKSTEPPRGLTVLAAASGDEIASTDEAQGHGLFTYQLLSALNAGAKAGRPVTARDAHAALKTKVQDAARRQNRSQTPTLEGPEFELLR